MKRGLLAGRATRAATGDAYALLPSHRWSPLAADSPKVGLGEKPGQGRQLDSDALPGDALVLFVLGAGIAL